MEILLVNNKYEIYNENGDLVKTVSTRDEAEDFVQKHTNSGGE